MGNKFYKLQEIAAWQLSGNQTVKLPELQRGFVWNTSQVETLWDSILRGFPIGSFLMTQSGNDLLLVDGQQRSTSIAYGFFNPWNDNHVDFFDKGNKDSKHIPVLWIDLDPKDKLTDTNKFLIKIVTRSHPWGYKSKNNRETLTMGERKRAIELFKANPNSAAVEKYTDFENKNTFTIDANIPIPLCFLLEELYSDTKHSNIKSNLLRRVKVLDLENFPEIDHTSYIERLSDKLQSENLEMVFSSLKNIIRYEVPAITTSNDIIKESDFSEETGSSDPTLFVRLNSQGTSIVGEELVYSIFKAEFPRFKETVEKVGADFILPSKLLAIVIRKCLTDLDHNEFKNSLNINEFRKKLKQSDNEFRSKLCELVEAGTIKNYFDNVLYILKATDSLHIPQILIKYLINNNLEIFTLLLLSVKDKELNNQEILEVKKTFIKACWFNLDAKKFVRENWKDAIEGNDFWTDENWTKLEIECKYICPLFKPGNFLEFVGTQIDGKIPYDNWYPEDFKDFYSAEIIANREDIIKSCWDKVLNTIVWNREVLIFVQRAYFNYNFSEYNSLDVLTATNRPWDWDHIYPQNYVYNRKDNVDSRIRNLYNHNCNLRALSYDINRSEGANVPPNKRFTGSQSKNDFFIKSNDYEYWGKINDRVKSTNEVENLLSAFQHRMINIYEEIFESLS